MRNPKWHRDEIILALDLYFDRERGPIDTKNPKIARLSEILNILPIFKIKPDEEKFRNPNGVSLKLSNFLAIDPDYSGKGMEAYSKLDDEIFFEFRNDRAKLHNLANKIKSIASNSDLSEQIQNIEDDESIEIDNVKEGQILYKLHKVRERDKRIIKVKKITVFKKTGKLECEVCGFDFKARYGSLGEGFIECHHLISLSNFDSIKVTKLDDLALVCSNCHRMMHRDLSISNVNAFKMKWLILR